MLALVAASACRFESGYGDTRYRCDPSDRCPPGFTCDEGICVTAPDVDAGLVGGESRCSPVSLMHDEFDDAAIGRLWEPWTDGKGTHREEGGSLIFSFASPTGDQAGYNTDFSHRVRDDEARVSIEQVGGERVSFALWPLGGGEWTFELLGRDELRAVWDGGPPVAVPFDPETHRHWRFRLAGDTLFWETSADLTEWHELHHETVAFAGDDVRFGIAAGGQGGDPEVRIAAFNHGLVATDDHCPAIQLVDGFDAPPFEPLWSAWDGDACSLVEEGGALVLSHTGQLESWCGLEARYQFDLRTSELVFDAGPAVDSPLVTYLKVHDPSRADTYLQFVRRAGTLDVAQVVDGLGTHGANVDDREEVNRYWRLRGNGDRIRFDTSSDGSSWENLLDADQRVDLSAVQVVFTGGMSEAGLPIVMRMGGFNAP